MTSSQFDRVADLFERCLELPDADREALLASATDVAVVAEVKELLRHRADGALDPAAVAWKVDGSDLTESFPRQFGGYELRSVIGRGAQGTVYEAWQASPARPVALKVLNAAPFSSARQRFEDEAAILARLQHPGIAAVYAVGAAAEPCGTRRPFIAMELVRGRPLLEHARGLGLRERLMLLEQVCAAVHHAHQKAVIHRDLKPGNILVDESGQSKVLDFGIARLKEDEARNLTVTGQVFGTLAYMSPEQVSGRVRDIDTQSDVYALGVIACELLTGKLPYDIAGRMVPEIARIIAEQPPLRPGDLDRALRGDIETIVLKALEKESGRRYQSARELGEDLRRYLDNQPITARPTTVFYQLSKLARRHRPAVAVGAMLVIAVVAGLAATGRALQLRTRDLQLTLAAQRAAAQMNAFMEEVLASAASRSSGSTITVREFLDNVGAQVELRLAGQPLAAAGVAQYLANGYHHLSLDDKALPWAERAWASRRTMLGEDDPLTLDSATSLVVVLNAMAQIPRARALATRTLDGLLRKFGPDDRRTLEAWDNLLMMQARDDSNGPVTPGTLRGIERRQAELAARSMRVLGPADEVTLNIENNRISHVLAMGEFDRADELLNEVIARARMNLGATHQLVFNLERMRMANHLQRGDTLGAMEAGALLLAQMSEHLGPEHTDTLALETEMAWLEWMAGRPVEALARIQSTMATLTRRQDTTPDELQYAQIVMANCLLDMGLRETLNGW